MKSYLVDTNVVIDLLMKREPFAPAAKAVFNAAYNKLIKLYICSLSYSNIYYILRRKFGKELTIKGLTDLTQLVEIATVDDSVIKKALSSDFTDFEDAIQYYSAESIKTISGIITRNAKDFRLSLIPIISPEEISADLD